MKGFAINEQGDIILKRNDIEITGSLNLTMQSSRMVIGTNKGEWFLNGNEGIDFDHILVKSPNYDLVRDEIQGGLYQVDETMHIQEIQHYLNKDRKLNIEFSAKNDTGQIIQGRGKY